MRKGQNIFTVILGAATLWHFPACAHEQIRIVGSSTVYPFSASVAEHFGKMGDFRTPVVESTGTGAGFKLFCAGVGDATPDITNASRRILDSERKQCADQGVIGITEVTIGYDGITLANSAQAPHFNLTKRQVFLALARDVPVDGKLVANPYMRWKQVDAALPDVPIKVYGMPPVSGTRDTFVELVMEEGCAHVPAFAAVVQDKDARKRHCRMLREDGAFIEVGENGNLIVQKLLGDPQALGILGFSFLEQNMGKIQGSLIQGVLPSFESIQRGTYPVARPLYFYVKNAHVGQVPGLEEYVWEFASDAATGDEGYLVTKGLVPLPESERVKIRAAVAAELKRP